jgi:hypothetical protein
VKAKTTTQQNLVRTEEFEVFKKERLNETGREILSQLQPQSLVIFLVDFCDFQSLEKLQGHKYVKFAMMSELREMFKVNTLK